MLAAHPLSKAGRVTVFLQERIGETHIAKSNAAKGSDSFSTFEGSNECQKNMRYFLTHEHDRLFIPGSNCEARPQQRTRQRFHAQRFP